MEGQATAEAIANVLRQSLAALSSILPDREEIIQRLTGELVKVGLTQLRTLDKDGLPKLGPCSGPATASAPEDYNNPAALQEMVFRPLRDCRLDPRRHANVWALHRTSESWHDEDDIKRWVQATIQDVIAAAGLPEGLQCCEELGISAERSSTWVVRRHGDPVGVVGVKRPGAKIVDNQRVHGQMYDCMRRLQAFHGLRRVFGIVTTYEQWRVYWLAGTDALARTEALDDCPRSTEAEEAVEDDEKEAEEAERVVHGSGVYEWHDSGLPLVLASVLGKMERAPKYGLMPARLRPRLHIDATRWWWTAPCEIEEDLATDTAEWRRARELVLLQDLGAGADGRVWKACTTGGKVCVLKFACRERNEAPKRRRARLGVERTHWREVWGVHGVCVARLAGDYALLMPFVRLLPHEERHVGGRVLEAIRMMANKGYCHEDLKWRHVGLIDQGTTERVVFYDLVRVATDQGPQEAESRMAEQLQADLHR